MHSNTMNICLLLHHHLNDFILFSFLQAVSVIYCISLVLSIWSWWIREVDSIGDKTPSPQQQQPGRAGSDAVKAKIEGSEGTESEQRDDMLTIHALTTQLQSQTLTESRSAAAPVVTSAENPTSPSHVSTCVPLPHSQWTLMLTCCQYILIAAAVTQSYYLSF